MTGSQAAAPETLTRLLMLGFLGKLLFLPLVLAYLVAVVLAVVEVGRARERSAKDEADHHSEPLGRQ